LWHELDWVEKNSPGYVQLIGQMQYTFKSVLAIKPANPG
jgi:hypothetical protein